MSRVSLRRLSGDLMELSPDALDGFRGDLIAPDGPGYHEARAIWNGMIDRRPGLIAICEGVADVVRAVRFAREHDLLVSIRGGGHNIAGNAVCDGGLMIHLGRMNQVRVEPAARIAHAGPGCSLGDLDQATLTFGQVVPAGIVTTTGIAGLTLGGGFGWLSRKWGLTCDRVRSMDVVTVDGNLVRASADENPDLFWALRGGGGNFGIVTSFEYELMPFGPVATAGLVVHRLEDGPEAFAFFRDFLATAPEEVTGIFVLRVAPPAPFLPEEIHGKPIAALGAAYAGSPEDGMKILAPVKEFGNPVADVLVPKPFTVHQAALDAGQPEGSRYYWKAEYLDDMGPGQVDTLVGRAERLSSPATVMAAFQLGGAVSRVGEDETAYGHRDAGYALNLNAQWFDPAEDEAHIEWTRAVWQEMRPYSVGGGYINFQSQDEGEDRVLGTYGREKYERLVEVKTKYDPDNFLRMNQNIRPR